MIIVSSQRTRRLARLELEFAAGMSHEVRTPLAVIGSASDNLAEGVVVAPELVKEYGALIRREARRLSGMVEQTLQFSAMQSGSLRYELSAVDAREVVSGALAELAPALSEAGFQVAEHVDEGVPFVLANPSALSRCVQNLVTNAMKYGGEGRWVAVRIEKTPHENRTVRVSVADRGPGILAEDLSHIFDAFFQGHSANGLKSQGVGLGLALTKDMVKAMGGTITVDAKPGRGATFTLHLQVAGNGSKNTPR
jgi:signal transduction histidine kinase